MSLASPVALSVSQLNNQVKYLLEKDFSNIIIRGEISSVNRYPSGHTYFTIKDVESEINCVAFSSVKNSQDLDVGLDMNFTGNLSLYHPKGRYQFLVHSFKKNKTGDIWAEYLKLKKKLLNEGLFEAINKSPIPRFPFKIGIISSLEGAVIHDMSKILKRRTPHIKILAKDSKVQGVGAVENIIDGINYFNQDNSIDLIIIARGGGSFEDLDCFNSEKLARYIFKSKKPIVSAIGHETDFTIADYVSDFRASTPSVAAEIISQATNDILLEIDNYQNRLNQVITDTVNHYKGELSHFKIRLSYEHFSKYLDKLLDSKKDIDHIMHSYIDNKMRYFSDSLSQYIKRLNNNNLKTILNKGFSITKNKKGNVISSVNKVLKGEELFIELKDGLIGVKVIEKK